MKVLGLVLMAAGLYLLLLVWVRTFDNSIEPQALAVGLLVAGWWIVRRAFVRRY